MYTQKMYNIGKESKKFIAYNYALLRIKRNGDERNGSNY